MSTSPAPVSTLERPPGADLAVDTSAVAAVLLGEEQGPLCADVVGGALGPIMSSANVLELQMVMERYHDRRGLAEVDVFLHEARIVTVPVDDTITRVAHRAWQLYGRGRHAAKLNFGDCFAYAVAKHWELPLLCTGDDFRRTDLALALPA